MPRHNENLRQWMATVMAAVVGVTWAGCTSSERADVTPVTGTVLLDGKPLTFGSVTFQPMRGQPAQGKIASDGTFTLSTYRPGDGAAVGHHHVKIACYASQDPAAKKAAASESLGESLIPTRYCSFDTSGLEVAVLAGGNKPFRFELKSEGAETKPATTDNEAKETPQEADKSAAAKEDPAGDVAKPAKDAGPSAPPASEANPPATLPPAPPASSPVGEGTSGPAPATPGETPPTSKQ